MPRLLYCIERLALSVREKTAAEDHSLLKYCQVQQYRLRNERKGISISDETMAYLECQRFVLVWEYDSARNGEG